MISCKEASQLSLKREERPLSLDQAIRLQVHLMFCRFCRAFVLQSKWINAVVRKLEVAEHLEEGEKRKMKQHLIDSEKTDL